MPNRAPSFPRYLNPLPHSGFWGTLAFEPPCVRMLFRMDSLCLAQTLFSIAEIMGESVSIKIDDNTYLPNFGFVIFSDRENNYESDVIENKGISKKELIKALEKDGIINIFDVKANNKRTFVDCLLNRNVDIESLYHLIRKSIPMLPSRRRAKSFLNVLSYTTTENATKLLCQKSMRRIGLMNRFIFIKDNLLNRDDSFNETFETIIKTSLQISKKHKETIFRITASDKNDIDSNCNNINLMLKEIPFIKDNIRNLSELYRSTSIKIYCILRFLKKDSFPNSPNWAWSHADVLARKLINEKIYLLEKISKNKLLYKNLSEFLKPREIIASREIQRKFQYADKAVLHSYINHFLELEILSKQLCTRFKGKKLPQLFHVVGERIDTDGGIKWELYPPSVMIQDF
ncbi:hypothetical protein [Desulfovibrio intestinalis]|uniref:Uncharacterized protein n=1 Tax=Desulfovibrio intestinalis TaxID=58621 RepID=A0A7W8C4J8_9BACT|nr:hypothetical protein [Desulfovibrio intestinalis]MBB5144312.1 hypothetical protein [Desulfovibrio intestinalis]